MNDKVVIYVRHGESWSNKLGSRIGSTFIFDPKLTPKGIEQANSISEFINTFNPEVCISSPLKRCLETANISLLRSLNNKIVCSLCTEIISESDDIGSNLSELKQEYQNWDFSNIKNNWWWHPGNIQNQKNSFGLSLSEGMNEVNGLSQNRENERDKVEQSKLSYIKSPWEESYFSARRRKKDFINFIKSLPYRKIVVYSHGTFLKYLTGIDNIKNCNIIIQKNNKFIKYQNKNFYSTKMNHKIETSKRVSHKIEFKKDISGNIRNHHGSIIIPRERLIEAHCEGNGKKHGYDKEQIYLQAMRGNFQDPISGKKLPREVILEVGRYAGTMGAQPKIDFSLANENGNIIDSATGKPISLLNVLVCEGENGKPNCFDIERVYRDYKKGKTMNPITKKHFNEKETTAIKMYGSKRKLNIVVDKNNKKHSFKEYQTKSLGGLIRRLLPYKEDAYNHDVIVMYPNKMTDEMEFDSLYNYDLKKTKIKDLPRVREGTVNLSIVPISRQNPGVPDMQDKIDDYVMSKMERRENKMLTMI